MKLSVLATTGRDPAAPLAISMPAGDVEVIRWLRVLPGQRYVAEATWSGKHVLAKLFVGDKAERALKREREGVRLLQMQQITTPELLAEGHESGEGGWLLFAFLDHAQSIDDRWAAVQSEPLLSDSQSDVLAQALSTLAQMHLRGIWHDDLHLDNLLYRDGATYVIDGDGVAGEQPGRALSRAKVLENLGIFFAQLPSTIDPHIETLLVHYLLVNGEHALPLEALLANVQRVRAWRLRDYLAKAGRDCSLFSVSRNGSELQAIRRVWRDRLQPVLLAADEHLERGVRYKGGGTATVARIEVQGEAVLLKRYNIKGATHWLRRFWRPSRAWHSWIEGLRLEFLGIATARPLGMLETRWMGLRGRAYLVTEHLDGQDIIARFAPYIEATPPDDELAALDTLFAALRTNRISHGDLKGHNIFWHQGRWTLIDLDAVQQHKTEAGFEAAYARDRARFLRNWPASSALHALLDARLPRAD